MTKQSTEQLWQAVLGELEVALSVAEYGTWFAQTHILSQEGSHFVVGVANNFAKMRMKDKYEKKIRKIIEKITKLDGVSVDFSLSSESAARVKKRFAGTGTVPKGGGRVSTGQDGEQATLSFDLAQSNLNGKYTFAKFIVGSGNRFAHAAAMSVAEQPGGAYNPLFLYSGVGLGKTHLLQAVGLEVVRRRPDSRVFYVTAEQFTNEVILAIRKQTMEKFHQKYRKNDVLILDDVQFIAGKERTQEEFFHTFTTLYESGRQILISSDRPPKEIPALEARLRSRFEAGLLADISPPDYETRVAILRQKVDVAKLQVADGVLEYVARTITTNIRELEGALNSITATSQLNKSPITEELAQQVLEKVVGVKKKVSNHLIIQQVVDYYGITKQELVGKRREKKIAFPRHVAIYLLRKDNELAYEQIGELMGGRDHSTVMHSCEKIDKVLLTDERVENDITLIREKIYMKV